MLKANLGGVEAWITSYVVDPNNWGNRVVYLGLVGPYASVRAIWAALMDKRLIDCGASYLRRLEDQTYRTIYRQLPSSGWTHLVIVTNQATRYAERGDVFYIVTRKQDDAERMNTFAYLFERVVGIPVFPEWHPQLWELGMEHNAIERCSDTYGDIRAWCVYTTRWDEIITNGVQHGILRAPAEKKGGKR